MKKKILVVLTVILVIVTIVVGKMLLKDDSSKQLELTYEINAGIPYRWEIEIEDESIVKLDRKYVVKDDNTDGKVGGKVYTNYVFKGLKKGTTKIKFKYVNFTNNVVDHEDINNIKVDDDLNVSLIAIPIEK